MHERNDGMDSYDMRSILRAEGEGMILRYRKNGKHVDLISDVKFDLRAQERATDEGMPEPKARK